ncbi:hypothetical protein PPERSA_09628 [Pseudocohnilembus persalinus]|uniref:PH domain-containing protein n=1 Tax=Pseudocohnilembus persalinus TaxID=266149 RepID=A0A0V0QFP5_PSEPJ|nr:hypothetical protein PPERSA_09628 [Pseudocohnilembus persalinus]|eukprot:KRX01022.1 hypothetical protein PPERSA_09628 [Pseudocohnilembus persalinus]
MFDFLTGKNRNKTKDVLQIYKDEQLQNYFKINADDSENTTSIMKKIVENLSSQQDFIQEYNQQNQRLGLVIQIKNKKTKEIGSQRCLNNEEYPTRIIQNLESRKSFENQQIVLYIKFFNKQNNYSKIRYNNKQFDIQEQYLRSGQVKKLSRDASKFKDRTLVLNNDTLIIKKIKNKETIQEFISLDRIQIEKGKQNNIFIIKAQNQLIKLKTVQSLDRDGWLNAILKQIQIVKEREQFDQIENQIMTQNTSYKQMEEDIKNIYQRLHNYLEKKNLRNIFKEFVLNQNNQNDFELFKILENFFNYKHIQQQKFRNQSQKDDEIQQSLFMITDAIMNFFNEEENTSRQTRNRSNQYENINIEKFQIEEGLQNINSNGNSEEYFQNNIKNYQNLHKNQNQINAIQPQNSSDSQNYNYNNNSNISSSNLLKSETLQSQNSSNNNNINDSQYKNDIFLYPSSSQSSIKRSFITKSSEIQNGNNNYHYQYDYSNFYNYLQSKPEIKQYFLKSNRLNYLQPNGIFKQEFLQSFLNQLVHYMSQKYLESFKKQGLYQQSLQLMYQRAYQQNLDFKFIHFQTDYDDQLEASQKKQQNLLMSLQNSSKRQTPVKNQYQIQSQTFLKSLVNSNSVEFSSEQRFKQNNFQRQIQSINKM